MKRILCSILVVVMLALTFVGCGYSVEEDKMTSYATINKVGLEELLKKIQIEDGDFTTDSAKRDKKVWDSIYAAVADSVKTDPVVEGIPDGRDVIYYSYYAKATVKDTKTEDPDDTVEIIIYTDKMKSDGAAKIQLGASYDGKDGVKRYITEIVADNVEFLARPNGAAGASAAPFPAQEPMGKGRPSGADMFAQEMGDVLMEDEELPF
jgi:hypothetical protein